MDRWDERVGGVIRRVEEKVDDSIAEMMARQAKQAQAVQAKALQKIVEDGFNTTRAAADAYFKAAQEERVIRGEPSDRLNVVQEEMAESRDNYERLKRLLRDPEFREVASRMAQIEARIDAEERHRPGFYPALTGTA